MHTALDLIGASIGRSSPEDRADRELIRNDLLALDEVGLTLFEVCLRCCEVDELIVSLVGEAGLENGNIFLYMDFLQIGRAHV